jgi:branched-subunit amino acid aminotransferase/4-amino-4-deoxychorismate lyase
MAGLRGHRIEGGRVFHCDTNCARLRKQMRRPRGPMVPVSQVDVDAKGYRPCRSWHLLI